MQQQEATHTAGMLAPLYRPVDRRMLDCDKMPRMHYFTSDTGGTKRLGNGLSHRGIKHFTIWGVFLFNDNFITNVLGPTESQSEQVLPKNNLGKARRYPCSGSDGLSFVGWELI